jgi:hypothetical protein
MKPLSEMTGVELRAELGAARDAFTAAQYQDSHRAYVEQSEAASARIMRVEIEIALREANYEAKYG